MRDQDESASGMESDMSSVARNDELLLHDKDIESVVIENNSVFVQVKGISDNEQLNLLKRQHGIVIINSATNKPKIDRHGESFSMMFPELYPFGRGHPGEPRKITVSILECVNYYMELSSRRFAKHHQFLAVAFDKISLGNMFMANYLLCTKNSINNHKISTVTNEELKTF